MADKQPLNPNNVMCVITDENKKEVGRIAASADNANEYITERARTYGPITVEYVEDADAAKISRMVNKKK